MFHCDFVTVDFFYDLISVNDLMLFFTCSIEVTLLPTQVLVIQAVKNFNIPLIRLM